MEVFTFSGAFPCMECRLARIDGTYEKPIRSIGLACERILLTIAFKQVLWIFDAGRRPALPPGA
jgi:hypothetical protein